ncbi:hypothetical protein GCM10025859_07970 [Alicyclobacillus fastidiosus]|nr:hypothetical protein GCM10025859_07970 [Alicyclobacillus fastidiosus]
MGARVTIFTVDGQKLEALTDYPRGDFENPVSVEELKNKFTSLVKRYLDETVINELVSRSLSIDDLSDVSTFFNSIG